MSKIVKNVYGLPTDPTKRWCAKIVFECVDSAMNGDPDNAAVPRTIGDFGVATDACIKRVVRDHAERLGASLYVKRGADLGEQQEKHFDKTEVEGKKSEPRPKSTVRISEAYFDVRVFGGVITRTQARVRGPVQVGLARSVAPVMLEELAITRVAGEKSEEDGGMKSNMGKYTIVPHAVYVAPIFFNPFDAADTKVTSEDLDLFWTALIEGWQFNRSARRSQINPIGIVAFVDESVAQRGVEPAHLTLGRVVIETSHEEPSRLSHYHFTVRREGMPANMSVAEQWWLGQEQDKIAAK